MSYNYSTSLTCLVILLQISSFTFSQIIKTDTFYGRKNQWTTGNNNKLEFSGDNTFVGMMPEDEKLPLMVDNKIVDFVKNLDFYIDKLLIFDFSNIDPRAFKPEEESFRLAVQRRMEPFFYLVKILLAVTFSMYFVRLHYGHLSGFKKKVERLRLWHKHKVRFMTNLGMGIVITFGVLWLASSIYSNVIDYKHIVKYSKSSSSQVQNLLDVAIEKFFLINNSNHKTYFAERDIYWPYFNIANYLDTLKFDHNVNKHTDKDIINTLTGYLRWCNVFGVSWWVCCILLCFIHKAFWKRRMIATSLVISGMFILLLCVGVCLFGYRAVNISMKTQICSQTLDLTMFDDVPHHGRGISKFVLALNSQKAYNKMSTQNYNILYAINATYSVYLNRLVALNRKSEAIDIQNGHKVKT